MLENLIFNNELVFNSIQAVEGAKATTFGHIGSSILNNQKVFYMADAVSSTTNTIDGFTKGGQLIGYALAVLFFVLGALQFMVGSEESSRKAKKRWIGTAVGLIVCVAAYMLRDYVKSKANFQ